MPRRSPHSRVSSASSPSAEEHGSPVRPRLSSLQYVGAVFLVISVATAVFGPLVSPYSIEDYVATPFSMPAPQYLLGTDFMGRDVLSRTLHGGSAVLWMSICAASIGTAAGCFLGMIAGYKGGWLDELLMRSSDILLSIPTVILALLFVAVLGREPWMLVILIGLSHAPQVARVIRGKTVGIRDQEYVEWAISVGASTPRILWSQILPNIMSTLMVEYGIRIVWSIIALASLSVLGHGIEAPAADWGLMINENRAGIGFQPYAVLAPLSLIAFYALGVNLCAEIVGKNLTFGRSVNQ